MASRFTSEERKMRYGNSYFGKTLAALAALFFGAVSVDSAVGSPARYTTTYTYQYDGSALNPPVSEFTSPGLGSAITYQYDNGDLSLTTTDPVNNPGHTIQYQY